MCTVVLHSDTLRTAVNVSRLLSDANSGSMSGLTVDLMNLLTALCSTEPVQMIGIFSCRVILCLILIHL